MAVAILCVWATHSSVPAPVCESAPEPTSVHESAPEPVPAPEMAASAAEPPKFLASAWAPPEVAASTAEPLKAVALPFELFTCPVTVKKTLRGLSDCPVMEAVYELLTCPATVNEAVPELSDCPVLAMKAVCELSACLVTAAEAAVNLSVLSVPVLPDPWAGSHGNSYIFYEVANSYEFVRPHSYKFIRFLVNRTYFTSCQFVWICTNDLHLTLPLNLPITGV